MVNPLPLFPIPPLAGPISDSTPPVLEPVTAVLAAVPHASDSAGGEPDRSKEKPKLGLVLGGGLPSIPAELLQKVHNGSYVELSAFLPERIQESFLYPDGNKKKLPLLEKFTEWVLAFSCFGIASLKANPDIGADLLTFMGTVARLARDYPGQAWASYEHAFRAKVAADPTARWNCLDQELWALALVPSNPSSTLPQKRTSVASKQTTCNRWNEDKPCPFKHCRYLHACAVCLSPSHRGPACPSGSVKRPRSATQ